MTELFRHERIKTTEAKARAIRPLAEKLVTKARKARAERVVELAKQRDVQKLSAWFKRQAGRATHRVWRTGAKKRPWSRWPRRWPCTPGARCWPS